MERNTKGLANILFDELEALKSGESTPQQARSKAAIANSLISIARLEMEYARFVTVDRLEDKGSLSPLQLT